MRANGDSKSISKAIEMMLQNAAAKSYKELSSVLMSATQNSMTTRGFDFAQAGIVVEWPKMTRKRSEPVALTFLSVLTGRLCIISSTPTSGRARAAHKL